MASVDDDVTSDSADNLDVKTSESKNDAKDTRPTFGFDLKTSTSKTDLVLVFNEKKMYVTKVVLEMVSPVFQKMFEETVDGSQGNEIKIEGKDYHDFAEFLAYIYPRIKLNVTTENVYRLQSLAFEYEVDYLKADCESVLADSLKDKHDEANLFKCMGVAYNYNIKALKIKCLKQAVEVYKEDISRADELMQMRSSYRDDIWKSVYPVMRSDASKFRFWAAAAKHVRGHQSDFDIFNDAKYAATYGKINWNEISKNGKEIILDLPRVWDGCRIWMNVKREEDRKPSKYGDVIMLLESRQKEKYFTKHTMQFSLQAKHDRESTWCLASVVIELINIVPRKNNMFLGHLSNASCCEVTTKPTVFASIGLENFEAQEKEFVLEGHVKVRIHILVNRPTF